MSLLKVNAIQNIAGQERFGLTLMEPKAATGTSVEFTGIPSWAKRITVMFDLVSTSGSSTLLVQVGSGAVTTSGYTSSAGYTTTAAAARTTATTGFAQTTMSAVSTISGNSFINLISGTTYVNSGVLDNTGGTTVNLASGRVVLSGVLDRVRITTVNGTDVFDAGILNVMYE